MNSYFPYHKDEWEQILTQAFDPDAPDPPFSEAYQKRKQEMENTMLRKKPEKKRICILGAAAIIGALGIAAAAPAVAAAMGKSIYEFFSGESYYTQDPIEKNDLTPYAKPAAETQQTKNGTIRMENIYCDGSHLSVTLRLTDLPEQLQDSTSIQAQVTGTLGEQELSFLGITGVYEMNAKTGGLASLSEQAKGECYDKEDVSIAGFTKSGTGEYCTVLSAACGEMFSKDAATSLPLQLSFSFLQGIDATSWSWFETATSCNGDKEETTYNCEPKSLGVVPVDITLNAEVQADTSQTDFYPVDETQDGYTLESVTVSPFSTEIHFSENTEFDAYDVMYVTDQNGNSYNIIDTNADTITAAPYQDSTWEAALTDAAELTIRIVPDGKNNLDATGTVFTIPITKGYRTQSVNDIDLADNYLQYIPPMPGSSE